MNRWLREDGQVIDDKEYLEIMQQWPHLLSRMADRIHAIPDLAQLGLTQLYRI